MKALDLYNKIKTCIDQAKLVNKDFSKIGIVLIYSFKDLTMTIDTIVQVSENGDLWDIQYVPDEIAGDDWQCTLGIDKMDVNSNKIVVDAVTKHSVFPYFSYSLKQFLEKLKEAGPNSDVEMHIPAEQDYIDSLIDVVVQAKGPSADSWAEYVFERDSKFNYVVGLCIDYTGEFATDADAIEQFEEAFSDELQEIGSEDAYNYYHYDDEF